MFYELFKEFTIALTLAMIFDAIFVHAAKGLPPIAYSFAGSLLFIFIFGSLVTLRAITLFGLKGEGKDGERD